jgi:hypothetical protein
VFCMWHQCDNVPTCMLLNVEQLQKASCAQNVVKRHLATFAQLHSVLAGLRHVRATGSASGGTLPVRTL